MKTIEYRTIDKTKWRSGPWKSEPDKKQWVDEETSFPCLIVRGPSGALCGYVGVSSSHPFYEKDYSDVEGAFDIHGGLTFSDKCQVSPDTEHTICHKVEPGDDDDVWWLGFDCTHCFDDCPINPYTFEWLVYRDFNYVESQVKHLAKQLKGLER